MIPRVALALALVGCGSDSDGGAPPKKDAAVDTGTGGGSGSGGADASVGGASGSGGSTAGSGGSTGGSGGTAGSAQGGNAGTDGGVVGPECTPADNVLANGSFETVTNGAPDGWDHYPGDTNGTLTGEAQSFAVDGTNVLTLETPNPGPQARLSYVARFASDPVPVTAGSTVNGSFFAKVTDWGLNGYMPSVRIEWLDATSSLISESNAVDLYYQAGAMVKFGLPVSTVPSGASSARIAITLRFDTNVSFDAMCLRVSP